MAKKKPGKRRSVGRPVELTPGVLAKIAAHVEDGNYLETSCDLEGAQVSAVRMLVRDGAREVRKAAMQRRRISPKLVRAVRFSAAIKRARAKAEDDDLGVIKTAGADGQWQARAWRLERRTPDRWGRRDRMEHSGPHGGAIPFAGVIVRQEDLEKASEEDLNAMHLFVEHLGTHRAPDTGADRGGTGSKSG